MYQQLANGLEIIVGHAVKVCLMEIDPDAWTVSMEGQSLTSQYDLIRGSKSIALARVNVWLEMIGLKLENNQIVEIGVAA